MDGGERVERMATDKEDDDEEDSEVWWEASGTGQDRCGGSVEKTHAADRGMTTTEAHPDQLAALQKSFGGTFNNGSV